MVLGHMSIFAMSPFLRYVPVFAKQRVLRVQVHPMSNPRANRAIAHLLEQLNATEFTYPGTELRLVYSIAGETESPSSAPHQNPAGQEI